MRLSVTGRIASPGWSRSSPASPGSCCARWSRCCRSSRPPRRSCGRRRPARRLVSDITAPLVSGAPLALDVTHPVPGRGTLPADGRPGVLDHSRPTAPTPASNGLFVRATADAVVVAFRDSVAAVAPRAAVQRRQLQRAAHLGERRRRRRGLRRHPRRDRHPGAEKKPQVAGIFTDLKVAAAAGPVRAHRRRHPVHHVADHAEAGRDGARRASAWSRRSSRWRCWTSDVGPAGAAAAWRRCRWVRPSSPGWPTSGVDRHAAAVARHRRDLVRRRLQPDDRAGVRRRRLHRQLLPLLRHHRGAVRLVPGVLGAPGLGQHRRRVDAAARHRGRHRRPG